MHGIAGKKYPAFPILVGKQQILPPWRAGQHLVFDVDPDGAFELEFHRRIVVEHRVQRPVFGRILHNQKGGLVVGHVIVPAVTGAAANGQTREQIVAAK